MRASEDRDRADNPLRTAQAVTAAAMSRTQAGARLTGPARRSAPHRRRSAPGGSLPTGWRGHASRSGPTCVGRPTHPARSRARRPGDGHGGGVIGASVGDESEPRTTGGDQRPRVGPLGLRYAVHEVSVARHRVLTRPSPVLGPGTVERADRDVERPVHGVDRNAGVQNQPRQSGAPHHAGGQRDRTDLERAGRGVVEEDAHDGVHRPSGDLAEQIDQRPGAVADAHVAQRLHAGRGEPLDVGRHRKAHGTLDPCPASTGGLMTARPGAPPAAVTSAQAPGSSSGLAASQWRALGGADDGMVGVTQMPTSESLWGEHSRPK